MVKGMGSLCSGVTGGEGRKGEVKRRLHGLKPVERSGTAPPAGCRVQGYNRGEEELMAVHLHASWYKARVILQKSTSTTTLLFTEEANLYDH